MNKMTLCVYSCMLLISDTMYYFPFIFWWFALFLLPLQHENEYNEYYYILHNLCSRNEENGVVYNIALGL